MSLDIYINCKCCKQSLSSRNITHNLCPMWLATGSELGWLDVDGKTCEATLPDLERGLKELMARPEYFKTFNPENGWGSYDDLVTFIGWLVDDAKQWPKHKWSVSR